MTLLAAMSPYSACVSQIQRVLIRLPMAPTNKHSALLTAIPFHNMLEVIAELQHNLPFFITSLCIVLRELTCVECLPQLMLYSLCMAHTKAHEMQLSFWSG